MSTSTTKKPTKKSTAKKATRSGNPAKRAAAKASVASVAEFKQRAKGQYLTLPSGLIVRAKRADLRSFVTSGDVPNPLMELVSEALDAGNAAKLEEMVSEDDVDLDMVNDMYRMVERVVMAVVVEPEVHDTPESEADRDDDLVYVDEVDEEDKMFIFQWSLGGTDDIARFREEARTDLDVVAESARSQSAAKRTSRSRPKKS